MIEWAYKEAPGRRWIIVLVIDFSNQYASGIKNLN